ncbi:reverse transcriptase domain-containing protein [Tanacetum coccineum]
MDDEPMWVADRVVAPTPSSAITIPETANEFAIKGNHLTLVKGNQFDGRTKTDPHKHIHEFLRICDMFKYRDTENEAVRLMMFPLSLTGEAKTWLDELNEGTIKTWDELRTAFISRFFPPALFDRLLREIRAFSQHENESLTDAWLRMKEMLRNCHGHNLSKGNIIKIFYHGLNEITQEVLNATAGGIFLYKTPNQAYQLLEDKVLLKLDWAKNQKTKSSLKKTVAFADEGSSNSDTNKIMARMDAMTIKMDAQYKELQSRTKQPTPNLDDDDIPIQFNDFMKSQQSTNAFVKETFMDLKTQLKTVAKNHQALIQNLETKFDRFADKQSGRPSGSLTSNTQPNPRAENMLVKVGKFIFPTDFIILEIKEDSKVPLILGRPFLHTADAVIQVKQKQLNLGVGTERMIFNIDSTIKHSYSNDDTFFSIDVIDEILKEYFDALLDKGSKILQSIEGTILEEEIFFEFDKFIAMVANKNYDSESDEEEPKIKKIPINTDYKIKTSLKEPPDLELKPLPDNLEYVFLEEPSFLPVIISSQLSAQNKSKLISVLKKHKEAFVWKTIDIPGICPSFYKHKIQFLDDKKPVVQKQRRYMLAIFHDIIEESVEVFMDDFSEKCHFMVKEEIMLGHKVSGVGLEVDKAKIDVISKLPPPTNIKGFRSFLGHPGFYRRFIKDFSKIARPLTKLLEKDTPFEFDDECQKAFELLKEKLTCAPVIVSLNWNLPFELMCDASDFAVGAVLGTDIANITRKEPKPGKNEHENGLSAQEPEVF